MPATTSFATPWSRESSSTCAPIEQVRVPVAAGVGAVRADPADLGGEVEDELGPRVREEPRGVVAARQVVARRGAATTTSSPRARSRSTRCEPRKPAAARDEQPSSAARVIAPLDEASRVDQHARRRPEEEPDSATASTRPHRSSSSAAASEIGQSAYHGSSRGREASTSDAGREPEVEPRRARPSSAKNAERGELKRAPSGRQRRPPREARRPRASRAVPSDGTVDPILLREARERVQPGRAEEARTRAASSTAPAASEAERARSARRRLTRWIAQSTKNQRRRPLDGDRGRPGRAARAAASRRRASSDPAEHEHHHQRVVVASAREVERDERVPADERGRERLARREAPDERDDARARTPRRGRGTRTAPCPSTIARAAPSEECQSGPYVSTGGQAPCVHERLRHPSPAPRRSIESRERRSGAASGTSWIATTRPSTARRLDRPAREEEQRRPRRRRTSRSRRPTSAACQWPGADRQRRACDRRSPTRARLRAATAHGGDRGRDRARGRRHAGAASAACRRSAASLGVARRRASRPGRSTCPGSPRTTRSCGGRPPPTRPSAPSRSRGCSFS